MHIIVLTGPTASGKSQLAEKLAVEFHIPVINADSRQVYKEMKIGTARPDDNTIVKTPYFLTAHKSVQDNYSAGLFAMEFNTLISELSMKFSIAILCGGSGLYLQAALFGLDPRPPANSQLRLDLRELYNQKGIESLLQLLPDSMLHTLNTSEKNNPQRLIRKIEIHQSTDKNISMEKRVKFSHTVYVLDVPREELYKKINSRVQHMLAVGLEEEAQQLYPLRHCSALQTVGYNEWFDVWDGNLKKEKVEEIIAQNTRHYAKRQITWFRNSMQGKWGLPNQTYESIVNELCKIN